MRHNRYVHVLVGGCEIHLYVSGIHQLRAITQDAMFQLAAMVVLSKERVCRSAI